MGACGLKGAESKKGINRGADQVRDSVPVVREGDVFRGELAGDREVWHVGADRALYPCVEREHCAS